MFKVMQEQDNGSYTLGNLTVTTVNRAALISLTPGMMTFVNMKWPLGLASSE